VSTAAANGGTACAASNATQSQPCNSGACPPSAWKVVAIVLVVILLVVLVCALLWYWHQRKRKRRRSVVFTPEQADSTGLSDQLLSPAQHSIQQANDRLAKLKEERQAAAWCTIGTVVKLRQTPPLQGWADWDIPAGLIGVIISGPDDAAMIELQFVDGRTTGRIKASGAAPATQAEAADFNCQTLLGDFDTQLLQDLPPLPQSPMAGRTFAASRFKAEYDHAQVPEVLEMGACLDRLLRAYCQKESLDWRNDRGNGGSAFFRDLQKEALQNAQDLQNVPVAAQRMWTSARQLHGREFCFILNQATRDDSAQLIEPAAELARAINQLCVTINRPGMPAAVHPPDNICFRGGGFDDQFRTFFAPGRRFRQPVYLATSFSVQVARQFLARAGSPTKIMWRVHIDPVHKCRHVNLVRKSNVSGEEEYLFAPYSAFKVVKATWAAGTVQQPHVVELLAAVDNRGPSEELPLAPWS
jgi:hypothetical protein